MTVLQSPAPKGGVNPMGTVVSISKGGVAIAVADRENGQEYEIADNEGRKCFRDDSMKVGNV